MSLENTLKLVSENCLHGHAVPRSLKTLWKLHEDGDPFVADALGMKLLTSLEILKDGYGEHIANGDQNTLANVRAHQRVFGRLGFFAELDNGELLAFDFQTGSATEPAVVELDTEGQYRWAGIDLTEAVYRIAETMEIGDDARTWLDEHGLILRDVGELGSTTQFFLSLQDLHDHLYYELLQQPRAKVLPSKQPADPRDPFTWLLRPGAEVRRAIAAFLGLPVGSGPSDFCVWCDGEGLVTQIMFRDGHDKTRDIAVKGVKFAMSERDVLESLGEPSETGRNGSWLAFALPAGRLRLGFKNKQVAEISIGVNKG